MIIDELIAVLGYEIRGVENLNKFNASMNEAEAKARAAMTAINELGERLNAIGAAVTGLRQRWQNLGKALATEITPATASMDRMGESVNKVSENVQHVRNRWKSMMADMRSFVGFSIEGSLYGHTMEGLTEGVKSNAEYQREKERQRNANLSPADMASIDKAAGQINTQYPSVGFVNAMEMARTARVMMGTTEKALEILPELSKAYVSIQQAKGDTAPDQLQKLLRAIDDAGKNTPDAAGRKDVHDILEGIVKATQVEGSLLSPGDLWNFIRRSKNAGPGFSADFLAATAPIFMQNMSASTAGTAMSSLYQNLQLGAAKKAALEEQERIGIRIPDPKRPGQDMLKSGELFAQNPYEWVKQVYMPALLAHGFTAADLKSHESMAKESGLLSSNPMGALALTQMVVNRRQIEKLLSQYGESKGLKAADTAASGDPFVAWRGFMESLARLAASIKGMPEAVAGLNALTGGIERFAAALHDQSGPAQAALAGGGILGLLGAFKAGKGLWDLATAGTSLQAAAASLEEAAISLGAGGKAGALESATTKGGIWAMLRSGLPWAASLAGRASPWIAAAIAGYKGLDAVPHDAMASALRGNSNLMIDMENQRRNDAQYPGGFEGGMHRAFTDSGPRPGSWMFANMAKVNGGAQTVINDSSNRSVTVQANIALTVQQVAQAASQAAAATAKAVTGALGGINPARTTPGPSF